MDEQILYSVTSLTKEIKDALESIFSNIRVEGEISNFKVAASGHWYFTLKDSDSSLQAVMFKHNAWRVDSLPKDGDQVEVNGSISVYAVRGTYQIICTSMKKGGGIGALLQELENRRVEFAKAGYFDEEKKKPLPLYPKKVGVITSPTGAAITDILKTLKRRSRFIDVIILPALVQGEEAAASIAKQIKWANKHSVVDVLIVGRGGGSLEDLLPFSDRLVVQAISESSIPIVSGVGHEIDTVLSDFAADKRASTPTAAAELVSEKWVEVVSLFQRGVETLTLLIDKKIHYVRSQGAAVNPKRMEEYIRRVLDTAHLKSGEVTGEITRLTTQKFERAGHAIKLITNELENLSPLASLKRGYSIVTKEKSVITDSQSLAVGDTLTLTFAKGGALVTTDSLIGERDEH